MQRLRRMGMCTKGMSIRQATCIVQLAEIYQIIRGTYIDRNLSILS